ncbi:Hypothetical predicted protein [Olea europaea subsp. europaea]|uniref:ZF-HD dimerization-type domain-containing protein n=1 Tax=Olea europaea subsp. europaea TaxID=158383 RepID=A0A8S0Q530_OLEEU|nr:Hypothetical predicted protein [Olea europaea subsp. europaea]
MGYRLQTCRAFEEEHEGEVSSFYSLGNSNSTRPAKMPSPAKTSLRKPRYKQCLKNHAVGISGHAVDGCIEFMAAGVNGSLDALKCAACNCHRNFHQKETEGANQQQQLLLTHHPHGHFSYRSPSGYLHVAHPQQQRPPLALRLTLGGGAGSGSRDELEDYYSNPSSSTGKKREDLVSPAVVEKVVKRLMDSIVGEEMQKRAAELRDAINQSVMEGGATRKEMDSFIAHITGQPLPSEI